jgi:hypothetical protein
LEDFGLLEPGEKSLAAVAIPISDHYYRLSIGPVKGGLSIKSALEQDLASEQSPPAAPSEEKKRKN